MPGLLLGFSWWNSDDDDDDDRKKRKRRDHIKNPWVYCIHGDWDGPLVCLDGHYQREHQVVYKDADK